MKTEQGGKVKIKKEVLLVYRFFVYRDSFVLNKWCSIPIECSKKILNYINIVPELYIFPGRYKNNNNLYDFTGTVRVVVGRKSFGNVRAM